MINGRAAAASMEGGCLLRNPGAGVAYTRALMHAPFSSSYLAAEPRALAFLPADFRDPQARVRHARRSAERTPAPALLEALRAAERELPPSAARAANLEALSRPGTAAVVTGQQAGLFLGPLYTFYKAASAIAAARALEQESGVRCVPLFWLQTEDHDFAEIDHCHVPSPGPGAAPLRLQIQDRAAARVSVAQRCLGEDVAGPLAALDEALGSLPRAREFLDLLRAHYRPGRPLAAAFAGLLAALFDEEGLLLLQPRQPAIAVLAAPLFRKALRGCQAICDALSERGRALGAAGFGEQVPVRRGSPLFFLHEPGPEGPRHRLERHGAAWRSLGTGQVFAEAELLALLDREPLRFSTSALLRPVLQDALLPTAIYVGGPGEMNYLAQLQPLYAFFDVPQPLALPRARFRLLEDNTRALLAKLGLQAADAERPRAELLRRVATAGDLQRPGTAPLRAWLLDEQGRRLEELAALDPGLREPVRRARESIERTIARLVERHEQLRLEQDRVAAERLDRLRAFLFPEEVPQERYYSLPYFACRHGVRALQDRIFAALSPFDPAVRDLDL